MAFTKDELKKSIDEEAAKITALQQQAEAALRQISAETNNAIGKCQGKIELYETLLRGYDAAETANES